MVDILIAGGTVVTMDKERRIIKNGSLAIEGNSIVGVGKTEELKRKYSADRIVEADGRLVLPGFVSSHRHLQGSSQCRGVNMDRRAGDRKPGGLYTWLMPMKELIPDEDRYYLGMVNVLADLRMGVTCNGVQDFGEASNARAILEAGMRGRLCEYIYSIDFQETKDKGYKVFSPEMEDKTLRRGLKFIDDWDDKADGRITCDLAPHATDSVTPELLTKVREEADKRNKRITIHVAQTVNEVREVKDRYGVTPYQYLKDTGIAGPDCYAAHCYYHTNQDIGILAETDTKVCHCALLPALRGGTAPLIPWLEAGITVGIGLDSREDMIRHLRATITVAAYRSTMLGQGYRPRAMRVLELATIDSAKVLGMDKEIGSLEPGKKADITLVDMRQAHLIPSIDPVTDLVYCANGNDVETVIVDGQIIVENGRIQTVNETEMLHHAQEAGERAWTRVQAR